MPGTPWVPLVAHGPENTYRYTSVTDLNQVLSTHWIIIRAKQWCNILALSN